MERRKRDWISSDWSFRKVRECQDSFGIIDIKIDLKKSFHLAGKKSVRIKNKEVGKDMEGKAVIEDRCNPNPNQLLLHLRLMNQISTKEGGITIGDSPN